MDRSPEVIEAPLPGEASVYLIAQERAIYEEKERNLISALLDLPGRSTAVLTACAALTTLLASTAIIELNSSTPKERLELWIPYIFGAFFTVVALTLVCVWLTLGALMPVSFAEFEPEEFVDQATEPMRQRLDQGMATEAAVNDYMSDLISARVQKNATKLKRKQLNIIWAVWLLRVAFSISIVLFAYGVIIRAGGVDSVMKFFKLKSKVEQPGSPQPGTAQPRVIGSPKAGIRLGSGRGASGRPQTIRLRGENGEPELVQIMETSEQPGEIQIRGNGGEVEYVRIQRKSGEPDVVNIRGRYAFRSPRSGEWITSGTLVDVSDQGRRG